MRVLIPSPLQSYTNGNRLLEATGATVSDLLHELDRQYPGLRFRMIDEQEQLRPHMLIYVGGERTRVLGTRLDGCDEVVIMQALSGG